VRSCLSCRALAPEGAAACPACGAALPTARFRLAPTTPEDAVAPPPSAPAPAPAQAPTAPRAPAPLLRGPTVPTARQAPPPNAARAAAPAPVVALAALSKVPRRTLVMVGAVAVVLMLLGGGSYYAFSAEARYPEGYLLEAKEMPTGMQNAQLPSFVLSELGVKETPGAVNARTLAEFESDDGIRPEEGWLQVIGASRNSVDVLLFAFRFADKGDADAWVAEARGECSGRGSLLRDRTIVVLVLPESSEDASAAERVAQKVQAKASRLASVC
jgi:hypothetical protein